MKKTILLSALLISFILTGCSLKGSENSPAKNISYKSNNPRFDYINDEGQFFITESILSPSLENNKLGDPTTQLARVFLPPSYYTNTTRRYPVVYYLHGFGSSFLEIDWYRKYYKSAMTNKKNNEFIMVGVNGRNKLNGSFYVNSPATGNWEDYIVKDIVPHIDNKYRTIAKPTSRGISGFSMGGFGALYIGFRHPDVFSSIFAISPAIFDAKDIVRVVKTMNQQMTTAYGAAFAPDLNIEYPFAGILTLNGTKKDNQILYKWVNGIGNMDKKAKLYQNNIKMLNGIQIDYGTKDFFDWIPGGCKQLSNTLNSLKIDNKLIKFNGSHGDQNIKIFEKDMIPYFSKKLKFK